MLCQKISKNQFDLLFENSKDFVYFMERIEEDDYRYLYMNQSSINLLSEESLGKTMTEVLKPNQYAIIIENYNRAIETKIEISYQDYVYFEAEVKKYETTVIPIEEEGKSFIFAQTKEIIFDRDIEDKYLFMRSVFSNTFLSTVLISDDGRLLEANPQFLEDFDLKLDEVRLKNFLELPFVSSENSEQLKHFLNEAYKGKSLTSKLIKFSDKDGKIRSFTATFSPLLQNSSKNEVVSVFMILQEITQLIEQEKELKLTSHGLSNFKYAINSATEVSITDANGVIIDVNQRFEEKTGYQRGELIGQSHNIIYSRHSRDFFENINVTIENGEIWRGEICNMTKYGVPYWTETTIIPLFDANGHIQQYIHMHYNITEKKRMLTELRNIEHMFKVITENTSDLIVITNEDGIIQFVSNAYTRKLGYANEELLGQFYTKILSAESKDVWNENLDAIQHKLNSKVELIHQSKDGQAIWTEGNFTVVHDYLRKQGCQIIMVAREITERKEIENQLLFFAFHDALTQLPNRRYLYKEFPLLIEKAKMKKESLAVLYVDGDNFKEVNDQFGHEVGDIFIYEFGKALGNSVRTDDLVIRMGGDEFSIILTGLHRNEQIRNEQVTQIVNRINDTLKEGWYISEHLFSPTASIGISMYPDHGDDLDTLLDRSDKALYQIKSSCKNNYQIYELNEMM